MKHDTHVCYVNLVFHSYSRLFLLYIISQFYSFALHPHHSAQKGWTDLFQLNIIKHQQKPFPQSAEVSEDCTSHLCESWTIKVGLHNTIEHLCMSRQWLWAENMVAQSFRIQNTKLLLENCSLIHWAGKMKYILSNT